MKPRRLQLSGITSGERHAMISAVSDAISASGGWISDHKIFSNTMITLQFFIPGNGRETLKARISQAGVKLDTCDDEPNPPIASGDDEIPGSLSLTFVHTDPDLRLEVPAVPG